jgi:hypothetical protein
LLAGQVNRGHPPLAEKPMPRAAIGLPDRHDRLPA